MRPEDFVDVELSGLRDFQQATARYVFARMFGDGDQSCSRFLVADEVGLGKTLIARGVIAQAIDHLKRSGDRRIDIVYLASNSAIAAQNVRKLAPRGVVTISRTERLSMLPYAISGVERADVNIFALTPGTSLEFGNAGGKFTERACAFAALRSIWSGHRLRGSGIARIFAGAIKASGGTSPEQRLRDEADRFGHLPAKPQRYLLRAIHDVDRARRAEGLLGLDEELHDLAPRYAAKRESREDRERRSRLIRDIRSAMAWTGVQLLQPDLVVLDEFQRFRSLLDETSADDIGDIARAMFNHEHRRHNRSTRVLLLSATPYVPHTTVAEVTSGDVSHYEDFLATYRFLAAGLPTESAPAAEARLREGLDRVRTGILDVELNGVEPVRTAAREVTEQLTRVMVRTERLAATEDHNGMLVTVPDEIGVPSASSLSQYIGTAKVAQYLRDRDVVSTSDVMEYWKSAPYTLSYLGGHDYLLGKAMRSRTQGRRIDSDLMARIRDSRAVLKWNAVRAYKQVDPANGRLERLWADFFDAGAHRLLWLPPACPYYRYPGRFDAEPARQLTKRLVFSAWALVPTAISTLTSYEVERLLHVEAKAAGAAHSRYQEPNNRRHTRHLRFAAGTQSMSTLVFVIPSPALAALGDPLEEAAGLTADDVPPTWAHVITTVRERVAAALADHLPPERGAGPGSSAWYTLAPMLLDWLARDRTGFDPHEVHGDGVDLDEPDSPVNRYFDAVLAMLDTLVDSGSAASSGALPLVPDDLEDVLALIALSSPPNCTMRALARTFGDLSPTELVQASIDASAGVLSLFNSWEATRIIDAARPNGDFWLKALHYCAEGHLQSVLDEYVAALTEWRGFDREQDRMQALSETVADLVDVMSLRTSAYSVVTPHGSALANQMMRGRFAVRFGRGVSETQDEQRAELVSLAFNSPFWPFILTTTSIGQEGLDFHLYCHAVSHWNLPTNAVDLEQREGRVHRYKGHAVRKNVAAAVGRPSGETEPWSELFARANELTALTRDSEIVPYWVFPPDDVAIDKPARIERHLPITPYSREASRIDQLRASLAFYRLAFGQPRQEELVRHVLAGIDDPKIVEELKTIRIDLTPPQTGRR